MPLTRKKPVKAARAVGAKKAAPKPVKTSKITKPAKLPTRKPHVKPAPKKAAAKPKTTPSLTVSRRSRPGLSRLFARRTRAGNAGSRGSFRAFVNVKFFAVLLAFGAIGTATLLATQAASAVVTVNDNTTGTGQNQFEYVGGWGTTTTTGAYNNDEHFSNTAGAYYQVRFTGTQVKVYSMKNPNYGIAAYSIDGGPETVVDHYASSRQFGFLAYTSSTLSNTGHTLKVRITGTKTAASSDKYVAADRVDITTETSAPTPPPSTSSPINVNDNKLGTSDNQFAYAGSWATTTTTGAYNNDEHYCNVASCSYTVKFTGTQIKVWTMKHPNYGNAAYSVDGGPETVVDHYNASRVFNFNAYTSPVLASGSHTLKVRVLGTKQAAAVATFVAADRVEITPSSTTTPPAPAPAPTPTPATPPPATGSYLKIVPAGDSIMAGSNAVGLRSVIYDKLKAGGFNFNFFGVKTSFWNGSYTETFNRPPAPDNKAAAVGGTCLLANNPNGCGFNPDSDTAKGIYGLIESTVKSGVQPDVYVIMGGINDRFCNLSPTQTNNQGIIPCISPFKERYRNFLSRVLTLSPNAYIFFSTGKDFQNTDDFWSNQKPQLEALASEFRASGKRVHFVDAWNGVTSADMTDSVHPNANGAVKVGTNYYTVIDSVL